MPDAIPALLRNRDQWVVWKYVFRNNKWTKVLVNACTGQNAKSNDPSTWCSFEDAAAAYQGQPDKYAGIGFVFSADDAFTGVDFDDCVDEQGTIAPAVHDILTDLGTYAEISPSGTGVKAVLIGTKPEWAQCQSTKIDGTSKTEIYDCGRFFTLTGHRIESLAATVEPGQDQLDALCARCWPQEPKSPPHRLVGGSDQRFGGTDDDLLDCARRAKNGDDFIALFDRGDLSAYDSDDSRADMALCSHLAFWTARDPVQMDRLFRRSALYREKWDREDYSKRTIEKAIAGCNEVYKPTQREQVVREVKSKRRATPHQIFIDTDEHRVIDDAVDALGKDDDIYQRGNLLSRVIRNGQASNGVARSGHDAIIQCVPTPNLRDRLTQCAEFFRTNDKGEPKPAHPPGWLVSGVESRGHWPGIRSLVAIAEAPFLRPDGSICQQAGYDEQTHVLLLPGSDFPPISGDVDVDDAQAALEDLKEVVCDFRFERPEHQSAWLAGLLTLLARHAFYGPAPLFLIDANVRGAGKGLLAQTIAEIAQGGEMATSSYSHEREEMRKKITTIAIAADQMVLLDNLEGTFGNDALDRALTTTRWKDRILGRSEQVDLPLTAVWFATGNNVMIGADTTRRVIHIRLDVLEEHPEHRRDFVHPKLIPWIRQNRPRLLTAALTILAAYCRAGRPTHDLSAFGSFEGWSSLVREAVVWVGLPDPCLTRTGLVEIADTTADSLLQLLQAWRAYDPHNVGLVISDVLAALYPEDRESMPSDEASVGLRRAFENLMSDGGARTPTAKKLGSRLRHYRRRIVGGMCLDVSPDRTGGGKVWRLVTSGGPT